MDDECANALWLGWMQEWLEDAKTKSLKNATTLKKACDSLKSCPLPMTHPSEAQRLNGFGPKTCERLEKRLREHCEENALPMPKRKSRKRTSGDLDEASPDMTPAKKPRKTTKPYVPQLRSGPYAILLGLVSIGESEQISKQQLIELAQPHCDASFIAPKDTTSFHTAWSSMKTLLNKDLVKETKGAQRRYSLTDEGWEVAEKMKRVGEGKQQNRDTSLGKTNPLGFKRQESSIEGDHHSGHIRSHGASSDRVPLMERTDYNALPVSRSLGHRLGGAVSDKYGTLASSIKNQKHAGPLVTTSRSGPTHSDLNDDARAAVRTQGQNSGRAEAVGQSFDFVELLSSSPPKAPQLARHRELSTQPKFNRPSVSRDSEAPRQASLQPNSTTFTPSSFRPITLQPSTFTIELILDTREIRSREDRTYIETHLVKKGIRPLIRSLPLGDFFWVAKCHDLNLLSRYGEEGDEIALDYIIERKRLDDLISSIKDGRFHEQKFRLRRSGVKNVVYLIEEIGISQEVKNKYWAAVQTAIASTQVVDGFTVKRTRGLDESIRYLARMTNLLKTLYEAKPLTILPSSILSPKTYSPLLAHLRSTEPNTAYNITYASFAALASKSETRTLRDVYLHMLMTTKGLTGDKAIEIQKSYPTPRALVAAFSACKDLKEREGMVEKALDVRGVLGRGKVGKALSKMIAAVWGGDGV